MSASILRAEDPKLAVGVEIDAFLLLMLAAEAFWSAGCATLGGM